MVRTHLELPSLEALRPAESPDPLARVERIEGCPASFFRYLYVEVGRLLLWTDRLSWTDEQHEARLADPAVSLHLLTVSGAPAGYFEAAVVENLFGRFFGGTSHARPFYYYAIQLPIDFAPASLLLPLGAAAHRRPAVRRRCRLWRAGRTPTRPGAGYVRGRGP